MNLSTFNISIKEAEKMLRDVKLFRMNGIKSINEDGVSKEFKHTSQSCNYFKVYSVGLENYDFDILLNDQSYFQIEFKEVKGRIEIRYAYFQNPIDHISYEEFISQEFLVKGLYDSIDDIGDLFQDYYDQFLVDQEFNSNYSTIRCDYDFENYKPLLHAVSHIHIGHRNNIRIPMNKTITPLMFVLFVIKHVYYYSWKTLADPEKINSFIEVLRNCRVGEKFLKEHEWSKQEELELFLN